MLGFFIVVVVKLLLLGFRLVSRLQGGSRELVGTGQLVSLLCPIRMSQDLVRLSTWNGL